MADPARAKKIADRIKVLVAETLEYRVKDERLGFITITDVRVTGDLQNASVFYTVFGGEAERVETAAALESAKGKIRSAVGKGIGIRLTPTLEFIPDALPDGAAHMEDLLLVAKQRDAEVAAAAAGATYAGDADPYRKPVDEGPDDDDSDSDSDPGSDKLAGRGDGALATDDDDADDGAAQR
jgi:ribosome-binding factor A